MNEPPRRPDGGAEPPEPPEDLPGYVIDPLERQPISRLRAIAEWVTALADYHENTDVELEDGESKEIVSHGYESLGYAVVEKYQTCGDDACACMTATDRSDLHGPYIYKVEHIKKGKQDWTYYGRVSDRE